MRPLRLLAQIALAGVLAMGAAGSAQAQGSDGDAQLPVTVANPGVSQEVINSLPPVVQQSDVHIAASFVAGTPIYYPNGTLVEGQSAAGAARAATAFAVCNLSAWGPPGGNWGGASVCTAAVWGSPGATQGYNWARGFGCFTTGVVQVRGYNSSGTETWYSAGSGTSGGGNVPWGNILSVPAARALSYGYLAGFTADWSS
jgi:hypothetical protein